MSRYARRWVVSAALALGIGLLAVSAGRSDDDEEEAKATKAARDAVLDLVSKMAKGNVDKEAAAIAKKHDIEYVMRQFKPRDKGGLGVGPVKKGDGIELKILSLEKTKLSPMELKKQAEDLIKMAQVTQGIATVSQHYPPPKKMKADPKNWKKYFDETKKQSQELIKAVKANDPTQVKKVASKLNDSCLNCHTEFRDPKN